MKSDIQNLIQGCSSMFLITTHMFQPSRRQWLECATGLDLLFNTYIHKGELTRGEAHLLLPPQEQSLLGKFNIRLFFMIFF